MSRAADSPNDVDDDGNEREDNEDADEYGDGRDDYVPGTIMITMILHLRYMQVSIAL